MSWGVVGLLFLFVGLYIILGIAVTKATQGKRMQG